MTEVEAQIEHDWPADSPVARACLEIWLQLREKRRKVDHYTYGDLEALTKVADRSCVQRALMYLATPSVAVLRPSLMYEFEGQLVELPQPEMAHFAAGEAVIHPHFGAPIGDAELFLAFEPGERLLRNLQP